MATCRVWLAPNRFENLNFRVITQLGLISNSLCQVIELPVPIAISEIKSANNGGVLAGVPHSRAEC